MNTFLVSITENKTTQPSRRRRTLSQSLIVVTAFFALTVALRADPPPVKVSVRNSVWNQTIQVAQISNTGSKPLLVHTDFKRAHASTHKTFTFRLAPNEVKTIGRIQGWNLKSNDLITITSTGYSDLHWQAP